MSYREYEKPIAANDNIERINARRKLIEERQKEIISRGYEIVDEYELGFGINEYAYCLHEEKPSSSWRYEVYVWKDGFFGIIDGRTGEELSPCVHLSINDAINDVLEFTKDQRLSTKKSLQKILMETLGENQYDPYLGSVVRILFKVLSLPNGDGRFNDYKITMKQCYSVALAMYKLVEKIIKSGGISLLIYDYGETQEFKKFCGELEAAVLELEARANGVSQVSGEHLLALVNSHYYDVRDEYDKYESILDEYIGFASSLEQEIQLKKVTSRSPFGLSAKEAEDIGILNMKKPMISITAEKTVYYPDIHNQADYCESSAEAYKKGVQIDGTPRNVATK